MGMVVIVARDVAQQALKLLREHGQDALEIGRIEARREGEAQTIIV